MPIETIMSKLDNGDYLAHYGKGHLDGGHSGRYPWGSGEEQFQHPKAFSDYVKKAHSEKFTCKDEDGNVLTGYAAIAYSMGFRDPHSGNKAIGPRLEAELTIAKEEIKYEPVALDKKLIQRYEDAKASGNPDDPDLKLGNRMERARIISEQLGREISESTLRTSYEKNMDYFLERQSRVKADELKKLIDEGTGFLDVSKDGAVRMGWRPADFNAAIERLRVEDGYELYPVKIKQNTTKNYTDLSILCKPGTTYAEAQKAKSEMYDTGDKDDNGNPIMRPKVMLPISRNVDYEQFGDQNYQVAKKNQRPVGIDPSRICVNYGPDDPNDKMGPYGYNGTQKDGLIEIRRPTSSKDNLDIRINDVQNGEQLYNLDARLKEGVLAQVRIMVNGEDGKPSVAYLKGVAIYSDDVPKGYDIMYNTHHTKDECAKDSSKKFGYEDPKFGAFKKAENDPDHPFKGTIKENGQYEYIDPKDGQKKLGAINFLKSDVDWDNQNNREIATQYVIKQSEPVISKQLEKTYQRKLDELKEIRTLTDPAIRQTFLNKFAEGCDKSARNLKLAAFNDQKWFVSVPVPSLKDNECYCPHYEPGTKLLLVRFPYNHISESPVVTVTDKNPAAKKLIGKSEAAIAVNQYNMDRAGGGDFDGDTFTAIPLNKNAGLSFTSKKLKEMEGFVTEQYKIDDDGLYKKGEWKPLKSGQQTQTAMGMSTNLINDMTVLGCNDLSEYARAMKYNMVVIDSAKHNLAYKAAYVELGIQELERKYQVHTKINMLDATKDGDLSYRGAATLVSRAKNEIDIPKRSGGPDIKKLKDTGELVYNKDVRTKYSYLMDKGQVDAAIKARYDIKREKVIDHYEPLRDDKGNIVYGKNGKPKRGEPVYKTYTDKNGNERILWENKINKKTGQPVLVEKTQKIAQMDAVKDARDLMSSKKSPKEELYADYCNRVKALANEARKEAANTTMAKVDPAAKAEYAEEIASLKRKQAGVVFSKGLERQAQMYTTACINRDMDHDNEFANDKERVSKRKTIYMEENRAELGALGKKYRIKLTDREWEAITKHAVTASFVKDVLSKVDQDEVYARALPKKAVNISPAQIALIKAYRSEKDSGGNPKYSYEDIANLIGDISPSAVGRVLLENK